LEVQFGQNHGWKHPGANSRRPCSYVGNTCRFGTRVANGYEKIFFLQRKTTTRKLRKNGIHLWKGLRPLVFLAHFLLFQKKNNCTGLIWVVPPDRIPVAGRFASWHPFLRVDHLSGTVTTLAAAPRLGGRMKTPRSSKAAPVAPVVILVGRGANPKYTVDRRNPAPLDR